MSDSPEERYLKLIERVSEIDINAAYYLCTNARYLDSFLPSDWLSAVFNWKDTPQGFMYWHNLNVLLEPGEDNV